MAKRYRLQEIERERGDLNIVIPSLLEKHNGNQKSVAKELGVAHSTICLWLHKNNYEQRVMWVRSQEVAS
jgi:transcriptional regulator with PAS, ATPase and Fis domain